MATTFEDLILMLQVVIQMQFLHTQTPCLLLAHQRQGERTTADLLWLGKCGAMVPHLTKLPRLASLTPMLHRAGTVKAGGNQGCGSIRDGDAQV